MNDNSTLYYLSGDHLGSASLTTSSIGTLLSTNGYQPFGASRFSTGVKPTDKDFTGQLLDGTGLHFYNARYYDSLIGRFISADTIVPEPGGSQGFNRYAYVNNNPVRYTDPSGHCAEPVSFMFCLTIGVALIILDIPGDSRYYEGGGGLTLIGANVIAQTNPLLVVAATGLDCFSGVVCDPYVTQLSLAPHLDSAPVPVNTSQDEVQAFLKQYEDPGFRGNLEGATIQEAEAIAQNAGWSSQTALSGPDAKWVSPDGLQEFRPHSVISRTAPLGSNAASGPTARIGIQLPENLQLKLSNLFGPGRRNLGGWVDPKAGGWVYFDNAGQLVERFANEGHIPLSGNPNITR
jgi:RHS repeat-associated protein